MNARVFLLVLVTGSFMAIWNSDQEAMQAALARRQKAIQTEIAMHNESSDAMRHAQEKVSHQVTADWEAFVNASPALVDSTRVAIEITPLDLADAEEVEVIELQSELALVPAVRSSVMPIVVLESWVQTIAPEDLCVETHTAKSETSDVDPVASPAIEVGEHEFKHAATHLANPVLASIEDALAQHSQDDAEGEDVGSSDEHVPADVPVAQEPAIAEPVVEEPVVSKGPASEEVVTEPVHEEAAHETASAEPVVSEGTHTESAHDATDATGHEDAKHGDDVPVAHDAESTPHDSGKDVKSDKATDVAPIIPVEGPSIPLPVNLASGTWRVVDAAGNSFKITIDRSSPRGASKAVAEKAAETFEENFCIRTSAAGERWCFIRSYETAASKRVATEFFSPKQSAPGRE